MILRQISSLKGKIVLSALISFAVVFTCFKFLRSTENILDSVHHRSQTIPHVGNITVKTVIKTNFYPYIGKPCAGNKNRNNYIALLKHWDNFAKRNDIEYVIAMGSLLGQYRNQDVIPWDQDIDVLVDAVYFKTLKKLAQERNFRQGADREFHLVVHPEFDTKLEDDRQRWSCEGKKVKEQMDSCSFVQPLGRLVCGYNHLDIFHFTRVGELLDDPDIGKRYNRADFYPFVQCNFMDVPTWCPNNRKIVLEKRYGKMKSKYICNNGQWMSPKE